MRRFSLLFFLALLCAAALGVARAETATVMVYLCASDLESDYGAATEDINEMLYAEPGEQVRVVFEAGGTREWQNSVMDAARNQRYAVREDGLYLLEETAPRDMTDPDTLSDFIRFSAENFPADRYILILWDHGGGSLYGFGKDENFSEENALTLDELRAALAAGGVHFDVLGFDACLMATVETALAVAEHADYLVASQEMESGIGWSYEGFLRALSQDPSLDSETLCRRIVDDFCADNKRARETAYTLSVTNLQTFAASGARALWDFCADANARIAAGEFSALSKARSGAKFFGYAESDLVDLNDLARRAGTEAGQALTQAISASVVYNKTSADLSALGGLSIYFPYVYLDNLDGMLAIADNLGWPDAYKTLFGDFASMLAGGQALIGASSTPFGGGTGGWLHDINGLFADEESTDAAFSDFSGHGWFNFDYVEQEAAYIADNHFGDDELVITEKGDGYVLKLTDDEWALINDIQLQLYVDDGEGHIYLGSDDVFDYDEDGDLIVGFDYTWVALNGATVPFYAEEYIESGDYFRFSGYVPVEVNGTEMELMLAWDSERQGGYVLGARPVFAQSDPLYRGLRQLREGDVLQPLCYYYAYDSDTAERYNFGDPIAVTGEISVTYEDIGDDDSLIAYMLTDIYGNSYWTEMVEYA